MTNRKFYLLINEFTQLTNAGSLQLAGDSALVCRFDQCSVRVENGERLGLKGQILLMTKLDTSSLDANQALKLNTDFKLTADGYIAQINEGEYEYIRHILLPEHPQELLRLLNEFVVQTTFLHDEIK